MVTWKIPISIVESDKEACVLFRQGYINCILFVKHKQLLDYIATTLAHCQKAIRVLKRVNAVVHDARLDQVVKSNKMSRKGQLRWLTKVPFQKMKVACLK